MVSIRKAASPDRDEIRELYLQAFPEQEGPLVARVAIDLLGEETSPETLCLVIEQERRIAGHIAFSPTTIETDPDWLGYILAPLGVRPACQKRGIGSKLIHAGLEQLAEKRVDLVFVYGDPGYYGRFGFSADAAVGFLPPYELGYPFGWQAIGLGEDNPVGRPATISCVASLNDPALW